MTTVNNTLVNTVFNTLDAINEKLEHNCGKVFPLRDPRRNIADFRLDTKNFYIGIECGPLNKN